MDVTIVAKENETPRNGAEKKHIICLNFVIVLLSASIQSWDFALFHSNFSSFSLLFGFSLFFLLRRTYVAQTCTHTQATLYFGHVSLAGIQKPTWQAVRQQYRFTTQFNSCNIHGEVNDESTWSSSMFPLSVSPSLFYFRCSTMSEQKQTLFSFIALMLPTWNKLFSVFVKRFLRKWLHLCSCLVS